MIRLRTSSKLKIMNNVYRSYSYVGMIYSKYNRLTTFLLLLWYVQEIEKVHLFKVASLTSNCSRVFQINSGPVDTSPGSGERDRGPSSTVDHRAALVGIAAAVTRAAHGRTVVCQLGHLFVVLLLLLLMMVMVVVFVL